MRCDGIIPTLVVYPELHASGFGNQLGMLLQHLSIAALGRAHLVVPPLHVPAEHRQNRALREELHADEVFNFTSLAPFVNVTAFRHVPSLRWMTRHKEIVAKKMRTLAPLPSSLRGFGDASPSAPIARASSRTTLAELSVIESLREWNRSTDGCRVECADVTSGGCAFDVTTPFVGYCHTSACRVQTRRAASRECRKHRRRHKKTKLEGGGCGAKHRDYIRLRNNYYFAHKLPWLLCSGGLAFAVGVSNPSAAVRIARSQMEDGVRLVLHPDPLPLSHAPGSSSAFAFDELLSATQREMLSRIELSGELRAAAAEIAASLGEYACVHVRLRDEADTVSSSKSAPSSSKKASKGLDKPSLLSALRELVPRLRASGARTVYVASNRPGAVRAMEADLEAAVSSVVPSLTSSLAPSLAPSHAPSQTPAYAGGQTRPPLQLATWHDVLHRGAVPIGLRAALIEHELCVTAPNGFAGSQFSTWANLIGARRWLAGRPSAYIDLISAAVVPKCALLSSNRTSSFTLSSARTHTIQHSTV